MRVTDTGELDFSMFPKIGRISVVGRTCAQVAAELKRKLEADYYNAADVTLGINQVNQLDSRGRVYLTGNVRTPGPQELPVNERTTVSTAIIRAGGLDKFANGHKVQVTRKERNGKIDRFTVDVKCHYRERPHGQGRRTPGWRLHQRPAEPHQFLKAQTMEADIVPLPRRHDWSTTLGVKVFRYKGLLKRYWWIMLLTGSCGLAWQGWHLFRTAVTYMSEGTLMVTEQMGLPDNASAREETEGFFGNELHLLADPDIAERARQRVALDAPDLPAGNVTVVPTIEPRTSLFTVTGIGSNGPYTQRFIQALMEESIKFKNEKLSSISSNTESTYGSELTRLGRERDQREQDLQDFIKANNMADWEELGTTAARYLADLKTRQANLQTELDRLQTLSDKELLTQPAQSTDAKGQSQPDAYSQQYLEMTQQLAQKKAELAERSLVWKPAHPRLIALKEDVTHIQAALATIEQQNRESSQVRIGAIKTELDVLAKSINEWTQKAQDAGLKNTQYQQLKEALEPHKHLVRQVAGRHQHHRCLEEHPRPGFHYEAGRRAALGGPQRRAPSADRVDFRPGVRDRDPGGHGQG